MGRDCCLWRPRFVKFQSFMTIQVLCIKRLPYSKVALAFRKIEWLLCQYNSWLQWEMNYLPQNLYDSLGLINDFLYMFTSELVHN